MFMQQILVQQAQESRPFDDLKLKNDSSLITKAIVRVSRPGERERAKELGKTR
jgi:hypothetical protein